MRRESNPGRIVAFGGGTGLASVLAALRPRTPHALDVLAVVAVSDDGGSTGRLRRDFGLLAPGDIRNCMVALSEQNELASRLFQYRFAKGRGLKGHSLGNLLLTALTEMTGDFQRSLTQLSRMLGVVGQVVPATSASVSLEAELSDGTVVRGESKIGRSRLPIRRVRLEPPDCRPLDKTLGAIASADVVVVGPGSLYTSIVPNLLVRGVAAAIRESPAYKVYVLNLMSQPGETTHMTAAGHVTALYEHAGGAFLDAILVNNAPIGEGSRKRYARNRAIPVVVDRERLNALGLEVIARPLAIACPQAGESAALRHDPAALAEALLSLLPRTSAQTGLRG